MYKYRTESSTSSNCLGMINFNNYHVNVNSTTVLRVGGGMVPSVYPVGL